MHNGSRFLTGLAESGHLDPCVLATAGNHDHAFWTDARLGLEIDPDLPEALTHATPAFAPTFAAQSRMLQAVLTKAGFQSQDFRYPNIGVANENRTVVLHHGHFAEAEYIAISHLIDVLRTGPARDLTVADIAAENGGWIDFLWPSISQTGQSQGASDAYQMMLTPSGFRRISARFGEVLTEVIGEALPMSGNIQLREAIRMATRMGLDATLGRFRDTSRFYETAALSPGGRDELETYLSGAIARQLVEEQGDMPHDLTFVFGHTHKPFSDRMAISNYPTPVKVHNLGGWTLNGPRLDNREGASMVLIDDAMNVAQVKLFSTPQDGVIDPPSVSMLDDHCGAASAFKAEIEAWLETSAKEWTALTDAAIQSYGRIQAKLLELTETEITRHAKQGGSS